MSTHRSRRSGRVGLALAAALAATLTTTTAAASADGNLPEHAGIGSETGETGWGGLSQQRAGVCEEAPWVGVSLASPTMASETGAPVDNPSAGGVVTVTAQTASGPVKVFEWVTPPAGVVLSTRDDVAPYVPAGLLPGPVVASPGTELASHMDDQVLVDGTSVAVHPSSIAQYVSDIDGDGEPDGIVSPTLSAGQGWMYVQSDPSDPFEPVGYGTPAVWHLDAVLEIPMDTNSVTLALAEVDGDVLEATIAAPPILTDGCEAPEAPIEERPVVVVPVPEPPVVEEPRTPAAEPPVVEEPRRPVLERPTPPTTVSVPRVAE